MPTSLKKFRALRALAFTFSGLFICSILVTFNGYLGYSEFVAFAGIVLTPILFFADIYCITACVITGWRLIRKGQLGHRQLLPLYIFICTPLILFVGYLILLLYTLDHMF